MNLVARLLTAVSSYTIQSTASVLRRTLTMKSEPNSEVKNDAKAFLAAASCTGCFLSHR